jgi:hypothetical protein
LVHTSCNSFKRNHPTVDVRPFLKLSRLIKKKGGFLKYDQAALLLNIKPAHLQFEIKDRNAIFKFQDGTEHNSPIYSENK